MLSFPDPAALNRRGLLAAAAAAAIAPRAFAHGPGSTAAERFVYVGTYTAPGIPPDGTQPSRATGISVFRMRPDNGHLSLVQIVPASNPSYLALNPAGTRLYAANENVAGSVSAYAVKPGTGELSFLNSVPADGKHTTHVSVHPSGQFVMAANYTSGNWTVLRVLADGQLGPKTADFRGEGNGTGSNPARQEASHAHQIVADAGGRHVLCVDLGADRVNLLSFDPSTGALAPNTVPFANSASGGGPRHMAFHPNGERAYVLNELTSAIDVHRYDPARGALTWMQTVSTLPRDFARANTGAEIRVHPGGRFLYTTNRGHNSVAMYAIQEDGGLDTLGWVGSGGEWPRGMNIDPSGSFLYAANQNSDTIGVFRIGHNGRLHATSVVRTFTPVDVVFGASA